jgi:hypothetical protein
VARVIFEVGKMKSERNFIIVMARLEMDQANLGL